MEPTSTPVEGAQTTASPPVPDFATFEREENARDLGRSTPDRTPLADSSPAPSGEQSASSPNDAEQSADSAPATPDSPKPKKDAKTRNEQLDAEITELREKLRIRAALREELAKTDRPAHDKPASEPAQKPTVAEYQRYRLHPAAPKVEDFDAYEDYVAAMGVFIADQRFQEHKKREQLDAESRERVSSVQKTIHSFHERLQQAREKDPEFDDKINPGLLQLSPAFALPPGQPVRPAHVLLQAVVESEVSNDLLVHFSTPEGQKEWAKLCQSPTPAAMLRAFGRVEARFEQSGKAAEEQKQPPAKTVTKAPPPPPTLGNKPPANPDRSRSAVAAGDYSAFEAAEDAADLARFRR